MGCFTIEVARSQLNQQLQKWRQPTEIKLTAVGAAHEQRFCASIEFKVPKLQRWIKESHVASNKKEAQNELALKLCRQLFALGVMPKYARSVWKRGSFTEALASSKYEEAGSFGVGLSNHVAGKVADHLSRRGYTGDALAQLEAAASKASAQGSSRAGAGQISSVPWSPPGSAAPKPWPRPKQEVPSGRPDDSMMQTRASLPVAEHYQNIINAVASSQVTIIQGATGSGKTTQVPQYILDCEDGSLKCIIVAQPRRLSAITVAQRVAAERGESLGGSVGYAVRFDAVWPRAHNSICYMTTGLLLKRLHQRGLHGVSHVFVDEIHERDLNNDLLLGLLRAAASTHPGLKIVLMSATIDAVRFQLYMDSHVGGVPGSIPVLQVQGQLYEVSTHYVEDIVEMLKWAPSQREKEKGQHEGSLQTCDASRYSPSTVQVVGSMPEQQIPLELARDLVRYIVGERARGQFGNDGGGAVLIFLPTWGMMSLLLKLLSAEADIASACKFVMLHSHVPKAEQMEAFLPPPPDKMKVILATNIAESSVTIDDVSVVIDSCRVKLTFFSASTGLSHNTVVWAGRANLQQRKGRAGRTRHGVCFRLCTKRRFDEGLEEEAPPELTRMPLTEVGLLIKSLDLGEIAGVLSQCLDPPGEESVQHAVSELSLVRALDDAQRLTPLGRMLARLPINPRMGLALLMGHWIFGLGDAMATLCAAMSFDEPFPFEKTAGYLPYSIMEQFKGNYKHSDQFTLALVHQEYSRALDVHGEDAAEQFCRREGLHQVVMRQVRDAADQLRNLLTTASLGAVALDGGEDAVDQEELAATFPQAAAVETKRNHQAIRDWGPQEWQWGAVQLLLATALPNLAVHEEKRHVWVAEDVLGAVYKGSVNCCKNSYVFPSPLFAFLEQVREGGWKPPRCRQLTSVAPLLAVLRPFAPAGLRWDESSQRLSIGGGWIPIGPSSWDTTNLLLSLRRRLEDVLVECASSVAEGASLPPGGPDAELPLLLREVLAPSQLRLRGPGNGNSQGGKAGGKAGAAKAATLGANGGTQSSNPGIVLSTPIKSSNIGAISGAPGIRPSIVLSSGGKGATHGANQGGWNGAGGKASGSRAPGRQSWW
eukprot:TRINITY_DN5431_c2_g1_i1.p1 TRINITY_DN5431_c2_g1~~TRINITY_DN5431_c2_g1_i1.p1  ORF type:complete len:1266 (+),score=276.50 TRINITY_DN5431_c2_g1_i1:489-3800(+)